MEEACYDAFRTASLEMDSGAAMKAQVREDDDYIIYEKEIDGGDGKKVVDFCSQLENFRVSFESGIDTPSVDMELFKAITAQLAELGWAQ